MGGGHGGGGHGGVGRGHGVGHGRGGGRRAAGIDIGGNAVLLSMAAHGQVKQTSVATVRDTDNLATDTTTFFFQIIPQHTHAIMQALHAGSGPVAERWVGTRECELVRVGSTDGRDPRLAPWWTGRSVRRRLLAHLTEQAGSTRISPGGHWRSDLVLERVVVWIRFGCVWVCV
jgi:hypothetical protein